ncbi:hypothetical protein KSS87_003288 [Heliosperma pusillum]|nr:hypothetical protein KSS87_003288 [Heliosperma pusillum]
MLDEYKEEWKKTGCTIMSDRWSDRQRRSICHFLVNSPKGTVFLSSIDTYDISETTDNVLKMLDAIVDRVGEENVVQIVTDNAANYKAAGLSKFGKSVEGKNVQRIVLDTSGFWPGIITCLKAALPLVKVLRMVDSGENPAMSFIYEAVIKAKEQIRANFNNVEKNYKPVWDIANERWEAQMQKPLHVAAYYLNPQFQYSPDFKSSPDVKMADWWDSYGDDCPKLKKFAKRILSLTCSSSGCERNWSAFEMVHTKKRNRLHQQKMNDLVFLMYNLRLLRKKQKQRIIQESIILEDLPSDDEWITEREEHVLPSDGAWLSVLDRATWRYARERTSQAVDENIDADLNATRCPNKNVEYQEISDNDIEEVTATLVGSNDFDHVDDFDMMSSGHDFDVIVKMTTIKQMCVQVQPVLTWEIMKWMMETWVTGYDK